MDTGDRLICFVMRPQSSSSGHNINASATVNVTVAVEQQLQILGGGCFVLTV